ncbi:MAG: UDP-N-acetylglucosamine 1-carboxyvinyltransferase [Clostridia bacterium]|nr:UDP-N-acetylglucosamine 1-carboxyvinyltransferase [Clostridia bacterium]
MEKYVIKGGTPLSGEVTISGAKNAVVAMIPAAILADGPCILENVPDISDVRIMIDILKQMDVEVYYKAPGILYINAEHINGTKVPYQLATKMRASYYFLGALLGKFRHAEVALPGGCHLGPRPIDQHQKGFEALGVQTEVKGGAVIADAKFLVGAPVFFDQVSVGATINVMLCACMADGITTIENVAKEPHIVDVANFLNSMGAKIKGAGTDTIKITGVSKLKGSVYSVIPDQIEAGTYMAMAAATKGDVLVKNVIPRHMECMTAKLLEMGVGVEEGDDQIRVYYKKRPKPTLVKTLPYPGFPTDMQPLITTLLTVADGNSTVTETIWDSRFKYTEELQKMGANITVNGKTAMVTGVDELYPAPLQATDLRAGAAMVIAGLMANGTTEITNIHYVERGYENLVEKITAIGGDIRKEGTN